MRRSYWPSNLIVLAGLAVICRGHVWGIALVIGGLVLRPLKDGLCDFVIRRRPQGRLIHSFPESWLTLAQDVLDQPGRALDELEADGWSKQVLGAAIPKLVEAGLISEHHLGLEGKERISYSATPKAESLLKVEERRRRGSLCSPRSRNSTLVERSA